ncbi:hypothetical protein RHSIM_Rhsim09G0102200 [Rhododendron simsii]|uniref:Uncharacterized protein n=1 Tax=Rhododendron simsii TaxID=118357 RepID=A0A834GDU3_RHOSS|nr:hypothetical protein RHSIM_Rhsim09G0102200 [Rhododendron simsii]
MCIRPDYIVIVSIQQVKNPSQTLPKSTTDSYKDHHHNHRRLRHLHAAASGDRHLTGTTPCAKLTGSLQFFPFPLYAPKTLKRKPPEPTPVMKDRPPPSSYGAVYVPPHQRLRSVITSASSSSNTSSSAPAVDSKTVTTNSNSNSNSSSFSNPRGGSPNPSSYPYLPHQQFQQQQQQKRNSQLDSYPYLFEEGSDRDVEPSYDPVSLSRSLSLRFSSVNLLCLLKLNAY